MSSSAGSSKTATTSTSSSKHGQNTTTPTNTTNNNNSLSHHNSNNSNTGNNTSAAPNSNNGHNTNAMGHNSSPILPMTPTSSVSPPVNVICKKEMNANYHSINNGVHGLADNLKSASIHDSIKEEMSGGGMVTTNPSIAYPSMNSARLGHGGNSTPLGSNSSIITTPSPPMTPSQNAISYVPNPEYFWQYNQYPNGYNAPANYYSQVDYSNQSNYGIGHSGYSSTNMGLASGNSFNGAMASQPYTSNGLDYMSQPDKYVNMV